MRLLVMTVVMVAAIPLVLGGLVLTLAGIAEERTDDHVYDVVFVRDVAPCEENELYLSVEDGQAISCTIGLSLHTRVNLPGFTEAQNDELDRLGDELGADGMSAADQRQFQDRVDQMLETVPREDRRDYHPGIWGARRSWLGVGMIVGALLPLAVVIRREWSGPHS